MKLKSNLKVKILAIVVVIIVSTAVLALYGQFQNKPAFFLHKADVSLTDPENIEPPSESVSMMEARSSEYRQSPVNIPRGKQTVQALYVYSPQAYEMWKKNPGNVKIIDCRTPEEYVFTGHPPMAYNIPSAFITHRFDLRRGQYIMHENPNFTAMVKARFSKDKTLLIMCRSGYRSAFAVNKLAQAGYTRVYNVLDGFEGEMLERAGNLYPDRRFKGGWKNSDLPRTYTLDPELVYMP